jgi:hypothetical protein
LGGNEVKSRVESQALLKREGHLVKVSWTKRNRETLDWCYLGDEKNVERIADLLSAKGQCQVAIELREWGRQYRLAAARAR